MQAVDRLDAVTTLAIDWLLAVGWIAHHMLFIYTRGVSLVDPLVLLMLNRLRCVHAILLRQ